MNKFFRLAIYAVLVLLARTGLAQNQILLEDPVNIRFEQYTGASGVVAFWRLPNAGVSTFPGVSCLNLSIPPDKAEQASRFMALYLFAKANNKKIFYVYTPSCVIISFGMDG